MRRVIRKKLFHSHMKFNFTDNIINFMCKIILRKIRGRSY